MARCSRMEQHPRQSAGTGVDLGAPGWRHAHFCAVESSSSSTVPASGDELRRQGRAEMWMRVGANVHASCAARCGGRTLPLSWP
eukprot:2422608-Prymnesium_polylepis.1